MKYSKADKEVSEERSGRDASFARISFSSRAVRFHGRLESTGITPSSVDDTVFR